MVIKPKVRGFICTNAHPVGCATAVDEQIAYVEAKGDLGEGPKNVLVIGSSTGYGLASRITSASGYGAKTLGYALKKHQQNAKQVLRVGTTPLHSMKKAQSKGLYAETINGDAFSDEIKNETIEKIKAEMGKVDLVIYSLASPRRTDPETGVTYKSTLKPVGQAYTTENL